MISLRRAAEVVIDLAIENVLELGDAIDNELIEERSEQLEACSVVHAYFAKALDG